MGVLTDSAVQEKKSKPIFNFDRRMQLVLALKYPDSVIPQNKYSPMDNLRMIKPDILFESDSHGKFPSKNFLKTINCRMIICPYYPGISSTKIKRAIKLQWKPKSEVQ